MQQLQCFAVSILFAMISVAAVHAQGQDWGDSGASPYNTPQGYKSQADAAALPSGLKQHKGRSPSQRTHQFLGACYYPDLSAYAGVGQPPNSEGDATPYLESNCAQSIRRPTNPATFDNMDVVEVRRGNRAETPAALNGGLTLD